MCMAVMTSSWDYSTNSVTRQRPNRSLTLRAGELSFWETSSTEAQLSPKCSIWRCRWSLPAARCAFLGNHENKLNRALAGRRVQVTHGLAESLEQLERSGPEFSKRVAEFINGLVSHYLLDGGRLVVAHAGLPERYHGRSSGRVRSIALYGDTDGETDEYGLPVRYQWAEDYRGEAAVVYGHTPVPVAGWLNETICLGHRRGLRRRTDCTSLARTRTGLGSGGTGILQTDQADRDRHRGTTAVVAQHQRCLGQALR